MELYGYPPIKINATENQITIFLEYMVKYVNQYVGKNDGYYYVGRDFTNDLRTEEYFQFESVVYQVFETIL